MFQTKIFLTFSVILLSCDGKIPPYVKKCSRNDPNIAKCIIESVKLLQPHLANGILAPGFNVPALEPLKLDNLVIDRGSNFQVYITNLFIEKGASGFTIDKMKVNINDPTFDFQISMPRLDFRGKYVLKTKVGLIQAQSQGDLIGRADNYKARVRLVGRKYQRNGQTYVHFEKLQMKIIPGQSQIDLKNLFDNNPALKAIGNAILSDNSNSLTAEIIPSVERHLAEACQKTVNEIIQDITYDEMFPDF